MIIAIGSTNPVKINAVKTALKPLYPQAKYVGVSVSSKVKEQPDSIKETKLGAKNRSLEALKKTKADLAVGLEGGVFEIDQEMYNFGWAAISNRKITSFGGGMCFLIPKSMQQKIKKGGELGPLMGQLIGDKNIKKKGGAISILTNNLTNRTEEYIHLVKIAIVKFTRPDFYRD